MERQWRVARNDDIPAGTYSGRCHHNWLGGNFWSQNFWLGGKGDQITCNDAIKQFRNEKLFTGQRYRKIKDQKPWPGSARNQNFCWKVWT